MEQPKKSDSSKIDNEQSETIPLTATIRHVQSHPSMAHSPPGPGSRSLGSLNKDIIMPQTIVSHGKSIESYNYSSGRKVPYTYGAILLVNAALSK